MAAQVDTALEMLLKARDEQAVVTAQHQARLNQLDEAVRALQDKVVVNGVPVMQDMKHLGIVDGTQRLFEERRGAALATRDIADALKARGVQTKAKNWTPTVYATLANSPLFARQGDKWVMKKR